MADPLSLLIADDEPLGAMALRSQLEAMGHHVHAHARDGRQAVELARCFLVDAAILDFRMPGLTGLEAAARIFRVRPLPILVLSGFPEAEAAAKPPAYHYLVKPVDTAELENGLRTAHDRFHEWLRPQHDTGRIQELQRQARIVDQARAFLARRDRTSQLVACQTLIRTAGQSDRPLHEVARAILHEGGDVPDPDVVW